MVYFLIIMWVLYLLTIVVLIFRNYNHKLDLKMFVKEVLKDAKMNINLNDVSILEIKEKSIKIEDNLSRFDILDFG